MKPDLQKDHIDKRNRILVKTVTAVSVSDGAGVKLNRSLGSHLLPDFDPFLMLDEFRSDDPSDYTAGFPSHPHRGFETITYMLAGAFEHQDSQGNCDVLSDGEVQWMTAGKGIVHSEIPMQKDGLVWGF
jgi:quercetin 2,3-dioxygenase